MVGVSRRVNTAVNGDESMHLVMVQKRRIPDDTEQTELDQKLKLFSEMRMNARWFSFGLSF